MRIGQGKDNARQFLVDNPEVAQEVKEKVLEHMPHARLTLDDEPEAEPADAVETSAEAESTDGEK